MLDVFLWIGGIILGLTLLFVLIRVFSSITQVVPQEVRLVVYRLGRFHRIAGPGPVSLIPGLDKVIKTIEVRDHPVEVTVLGVLIYGVPNVLTLNLWCSFDLVKAAGNDRGKLAYYVQINGAERQQQLQVKVHEAMVRQVAQLQEIMPLPATAPLMERVAALAPGSLRYNELLKGLKFDLEKILPSIGVVLSRDHPILITGRNISDEITEALKDNRGRESDSEWLEIYIQELRKQFPGISNAMLAQKLLSVEGVDIGRIQRLLIEEETILHFKNPYIAGPPIADSKMFFGRQADLNKIMSLLRHNFIMLTGPRRIGKTSLLYQLAHRLPKLQVNSVDFIPVLISVEGTPETEFFHTIMEEIIDTIQKYLPNDKTTDISFDRNEVSYPPRNFSRDLQIILKNLQGISPKRVQLVLLLDEMDTINKFSLETQSQLRKIFQRLTNLNLRVLATGVKLRQHWAGESSPFYNMFVPVELAPLPEDEARRLIAEPVKDLYSYSDEALARILEITANYPHRIQQLCMEIIDHLSIETSEEHLNITVKDVNSVLQTIHWLDEEDEKEETPEIINDLDEFKEEVVTPSTLKIILNSINDGIVVQDLDGRISILNSAAENILNVMRLNLNHSSSQRVKYRETSVENSLLVFSNFLKEIQSAKSHQFEMGHRMISVKSKPIFETNGKQYGILTVLCDITQETDIEEMR